MSNIRIIEKMKKLLALTQSTNENEALVATRKLHIMLAKHNIEIESLNEQEESISEESIVSTCRPWKRSVAGYIARLYFCDFYYIRLSKKSSYVFVGTESNRMFAIHIFQMVIKVVERTSRLESRALYGKEDSSFVNSFWTGAKNRICERCKELMSQAKEGSLQDDDGTTLPALLSTYDNMSIRIEGYYKDIGMSLTKKPTITKANNLEGFTRGKITGDKVQLSRALQSESSPKLIGG